MPQAEICIDESTSFAYSRAEAINNAEKKSTRNIFIITDADIVFDIEDMKLDRASTKNLIAYSSFNLDMSTHTEVDRLI